MSILARAHYARKRALTITNLMLTITNLMLFCAITITNLMFLNTNYYFCDNKLLSLQHNSKSRTYGKGYQRK